VVYKWKSDGYFASSKLDVQKVGVRIAALRQRFGDDKKLPTRIVEDAKIVSSPYHDYFWGDSDAVAAHKHRIQLARVLIANIVIVRPDGAKDKDGNPKLIRSFISVPASEDTGPRHYSEITTVMSDVQKRKLVVTEALSRLRAWRERYSDLAEFGGVYKAIDELLEQGQRLQGKTLRLAQDLQIV